MCLIHPGWLDEWSLIYKQHGRAVAPHLQRNVNSMSSVWVWSSEQAWTKTCVFRDPLKSVGICVNTCLFWSVHVMPAILPLNLPDQQHRSSSSEHTSVTSETRNGPNSYCRASGCPHWLPAGWDMSRLEEMWGKCSLSFYCGLYHRSGQCAADHGSAYQRYLPFGILKDQLSERRLTSDLPCVRHVLTSVCAVQQQFVLYITELSQEAPQLCFAGCFLQAIRYFKLLINMMMVEMDGDWSLSPGPLNSLCLWSLCWLSDTFCLRNSL